MNTEVFQLYMKPLIVGGVGEIMKTGTFKECIDYMTSLYFTGMDNKAWFRILPKK